MVLCIGASIGIYPADPFGLRVEEVGITLGIELAIGQDDDREVLAGRRREVARTKLDFQQIRVGVVDLDAEKWIGGYPLSGVRRRDVGRSLRR